MTTDAATPTIHKRARVLAREVKRLNERAALSDLAYPSTLAIAEGVLAETHDEGDDEQGARLEHYRAQLAEGRTYSAAELRERADALDTLQASLDRAFPGATPAERVRDQGRHHGQSAFVVTQANGDLRRPVLITIARAHAIRAILAQIPTKAAGELHRTLGAELADPTLTPFGHDGLEELLEQIHGELHRRRRESDQGTIYADALDAAEGEGRR